MGKAHHDWEVGQIQHAGVLGSYLIAVWDWEACNNRYLGGLDIGDVGTGGEGIACCARV